MLRRHLIGLFFLMVTLPVQAADLPGGLLRTAENLPSDTYELMVSPAYLISESGAFLTSELRYQPYEAFGVGLGFGAGEVGFNFGVNGTWHVFALRDVEPELALLGGIYFNRVNEANFFVLKMAPTVSQTFYLTWGEIVPYVGVQFTPSFRLGEPANLFSIKGATGVQFSFRDLGGLRMLSEVGLGLLNSTYELSFGISYPFLAL